MRRFLLPGWWDDEAARTPAGFTEAVWTIARHLGVDPQQLRDPLLPIELPEPRHVQFKLPQGTDPKSVDLARVLSEQVARFALLGLDRTSEQGRIDGQDVRRAILEAGAPWVSFASLLDYCWKLGIPVLRVDEFPRGSTRKLDGLAVNSEGRPAIILSSSRSHSAWLLFILAHELGHIAKGHVEKGTVFDGKIDEDSSDPLEKAANDFAIEVLTGKVGTKVLPKSRWPKARDLAQHAVELGRQACIDPGHIVLNYAHSMPGNFWGVANAALKELPNASDPAAMVREHISANLDWSRLPAGAAEFVARMTGLDSHNVA